MAFFWGGGRDPAAPIRRSEIKKQVGYQDNEAKISGLDSGKFAVEPRVLALCRLSKNGLAPIASQ